MTYLILNLFIIQLLRNGLKILLTKQILNYTIYVLLNDTFLSNELQFAQNDIVNALKRTKKATDKFTYTKVIKEHNIKDFIDPDKLENIRLKSINIESYIIIKNLTS